MSLTPSQRLLQGPSGFILESHEVLRTIPIRIKNFGICLDFHIFKILEIPLLIGTPIMRLLHEQTQWGQIDFKVQNSSIIVPLAWSINTIVEPEPEPDPIEKILMVSQEKWSNHSSMKNISFKKRKSWPSSLFTLQTPLKLSCHP